MENNGKDKGYSEGTSENGSVFPKKDKKSVKPMAVEKTGKAVVSTFKNDKKKINPSEMENNGKGKGYSEGTSKNGSVFPKKDKTSVKAMAVEKIVKATASTFKNDKKKIKPSASAQAPGPSNTLTA
ncbi:hypothetical protein RND71_039466 [Anisodus tanguticus]|uniref:Uncharacterized protein n=1 Tax=Anisodus tanguticus TaxID=243964 RepID=A0AAE1QWN4_9SOLA|nr:hypothetical protein RND71_039466 [Anisodus tanguticus]